MEKSLLFSQFIYSVELFFAFVVFLYPIFQLRKQWRRLVLLLILGLAFSLGRQGLWIMTTQIREKISSGSMPAVLSLFDSFGWDIFMLVFYTIGMKLIMPVPKKRLVFLAVLAYSLRHLLYSTVDGLLVSVLFFKIPFNMMRYLFMTFIVGIPLYILVYVLFRKELQLSFLKQSYLDKLGNFMVLFLFIFLSIQMLPNQHLLYYFPKSFGYVSVLASIALCSVILSFQYLLLRATRLAQEQVILERIMNDRIKQYQIAKTAIELINFKSHDLKNQLLALKDSTNQEKNSFLNIAMATIDKYDAVLNLENQVLNTLITQKQYNCQRQNISFSHMTDGASLEFISKIDLYTILGNALDNAIEHVSQYREKEYRQIYLNISTHKKFIIIKVTNPYQGIIEIDEVTNFPKTTKHNVDYHGFGLKSIQHTLEQYSGWLSFDTANEIFSLSMIIPKPE